MPANTSELRARSNAEILDTAFEVYRQYFPVFFTIGVVTSLPGAVALYFATATAAAGMPPDVARTVSGVARLTSLVVLPLSEAVVVAATSSAYLSSPVDLAQSVRVGLARPLQVLAAVWATLLLVAVGFVLFIAPGLVAFKRYFAVPATVVLEHCSAGNAMKRSRQLSMGSGRRIFALFGGVILFLVVVSMMLSALVLSIGIGAVSAAIDLIVTAALNPFATIVATLLYYDIRIRREGYDIELLAQALDAGIAR